MSIKHGEWEIHAYRQVGGLFCATGRRGNVMLFNVEGQTIVEVITRAKAEAEAAA